MSKTLKDMAYLEARVEGHANNQPLTNKNATLASNWGLSAVRATNAVQHLIGLDISADKLAAVGYADVRRVADNNTPEGRARPQPAHQVQHHHH